MAKNVNLPSTTVLCISFFIPNISVFTHFFCSEKERKMRYYQAAFKKYQISGKNFCTAFCSITNYKNKQIFYFLLISKDFFLYLGI